MTQFEYLMYINNVINHGHITCNGKVRGLDYWSFIVYNKDGERIDNYYYDALGNVYTNNFTPLLTFSNLML